MRLQYYAIQLGERISFWMMSSEIATYLTGRYVSFRIYTLSFQEYLEFKKQYTQVKNIHVELADYIRLGGFPATHLREYSQDEVYTIVRDNYPKYVLRTDEFAGGNYQGIKSMHIADFLLSTEY